jgi:cytochrome c oxidase subunit 3
MNGAVTAEARRIHASRLGMWVFLGSELLLFAGLFAVYAGYRARLPRMFVEGSAATDLVLGSANTGVLLTSSLLAVLAVHARRTRHPRRASQLLAGTTALGTLFLVLKAVEYHAHLTGGLGPGGPVFWTLYYAMTGLHALHVLAGMVILGVLAWQLRYRELEAHVLENGANYWHLVDLVWLFLWPLFYLGRR